MIAQKRFTPGLFILIFLFGAFFLPFQDESTINLYGFSEKKAGAVAIFKEINGSLVIKVNLNDFTGITNYSVYIIKGDCYNQGEKIYHLAAIFQTKSSTTMSIKYSHLKRILPLAVIVYDDDKEGIPVYCGEIVL